MSTAICWTLVHSIWQGLLLALLTGIVLAATRTTRPALRYRLLSGLLVLFLATTGYTFIREWKSIPEPDKIVIVNHLRPITGFPQSSAGIVAVDHLPQQLGLFVNANAWVIISIWLCILAYRLLRISYSLIYTGYIRNQRSTPLPAAWQNRLTELCHRLQVDKPIKLLESQIIKMPAVFGHWKPVIFIPAGILTQLPPDQLEAILAHELAHIRRSDFLMNLLQNIVESLFFFNPAILWLSARIRQEREHCCDDLAIAGTGDKKGLVHALVSFKQFAAAQASGLTVGFPGDRDSFLHRIARIVQNKNRTINPMEGVFLALSLVAIGTLSLAFMRHDHQEKGQPRQAPVRAIAPQTQTPQTVAPHTATMHIATPRTPIDTLPKTGKDTLIVNYDHQRYHIVIANEKIIAMTINGRQIPPDDIPNHHDVIDHIVASLHQQEAEIDLLRIEQAELEYKNKQLESQAQKLADDQDRLKKERIDQNEALEQMLKDKEKLQKEEAKVATTMEMAALIVQEHLVNSKKELKSFTLNTDVFIINGIKQPADVHQRYKTQFIHEPVDQYDYLVKP